MKTERGKVAERVTLTKEEVEDVRHQFRLAENMARYQVIKRFCYGKVIDVACGNGYGAHIIQDNPDIHTIVGFDSDPVVIESAERDFSSDKITFKVGRIQDIHIECDTLVSLETIEHIPDFNDYLNFVYRVSPNNLIITFPDRMSTNWNPYHYHNFSVSDIVIGLTGYVLYYQTRRQDTTFLCFVKAPTNMPHHMVWNLNDINI